MQSIKGPCASCAHSQKCTAINTSMVDLLIMCMSQLVTRSWLRVADQIGRKLVEIGNLKHLQQGHRNFFRKWKVQDWSELKLTVKWSHRCFVSCCLIILSSQPFLTDTLNFTTAFLGATHYFTAGLVYYLFALMHKYLSRECMYVYLLESHLRTCTIVTTL